MLIGTKVKKVKKHKFGLILSFTDGNACLSPGAGRVSNKVVAQVELGSNLPSASTHSLWLLSPLEERGLR